jgi:hypothetical protein
MSSTPAVPQPSAQRPRGDAITRNAVTAIVAITEGRRRYQYAMSLWASAMIRTTSSGVSATRMRSSSSAWM